MNRKCIHTFYIFLLLLVLGLFYISWRWLFTLNLLTSPFATFWSYALLFAEGMTLLVFTNFSLLMLKCDNLKEETITNKEQCDYSKDIYYNGKLLTFDNYCPSVDVLICTYNEPLEIIASTAFGAKLIDYPNKKVFILDDGKRDEIKKFAENIGVNYITREKNIGFKAGNINNALKQTDSDLVLVFDADHIPLSSFLKETVWHFIEEDLALVQTPQYFGNLDAVQKNLGMPSRLSNEQDMFYKIIEPALNEYGTVFCGGTNILIRRKYLENVNYFPESTVTEDSLLGLIFHSNKYKIKYYNRALAVGLSAGSFDDYIKQRKRWAKGNIQIVLDNNNWKYYSKLTPLQIFFYLTSSLYFLSPIIRIILLLTPVLFLLFDVSAIFVIFYQIIVFQISYFILKYFYLFNDKIKPANIILADVYDILIAFFTIGTILSTIFLPKRLQNLKFQVTSKTTKVSQNLFYKLIIILVLFVLVFAEVQGFYDLLFNEIYSYSATCVNLFWNTLNITVCVIGLKVVSEKPQKRRFIRINTNKKTIIKGTQILDSESKIINIVVNNISKSGFKFSTEKPLSMSDSYKIFFAKHQEDFYLLKHDSDFYYAVFKKPIMFTKISSMELYRLCEFLNFSYGLDICE